MSNVFKYKEVEVVYEVVYKNIKHSYIRFRDNKIIVSTSLRTSDAQITNMLISSYNFIVSSKKKMSINENNVQKFDSFFLFGKKYEIIEAKEIEYYRLEKNHLQINRQYFDEKNILLVKNEISSNLLMKEIEKQSKIIFKKIKNLNVVPSFQISTAKSYFGNCNLKTNKIKINIFLSQVNKKYLYLILCHEITHFFVPNHQKKFYDKLKTICKNHQKLNKELKLLYLNRTI